MPEGPPGHRGTRAIQRLVEYAPSTGGLALWVRHQDLPGAAAGAPEGPAIATDGLTITYRPAFAELALEQQTGLVAHEVLHLALRHPQRFEELRRLLGDVDLRLFTICADAIVNSALGHLGWLTLPAGAVTLEGLLQATLGLEVKPEAALLAWDVERLYRELDDRRPAQRGKTERRQRGGSGGGDQPGGEGGGRREDQAEGGDAREDGPRARKARALGARALDDLVPGGGGAEVPEDQAEQAREWRERLVRAHAGDGPHSLLRALLADLPRVDTPWEQVLRTLLARALSNRPGLSWSRPARSWLANQGRAGEGRRMPWEPGTVASREVPRLAVMVDVSGSIDDRLLERFGRELQAITRRLEAGCTLIVGDDRVRRVEELRPGQRWKEALSFAGRGGTDFTPLLEEADRHAPDIGVVLTDLDGPARFRPTWPVVWAVPEAGPPRAAPFGRTLALR